MSSTHTALPRTRTSCSRTKRVCRRCLKLQIKPSRSHRILQICDWHKEFRSQLIAISMQNMIANHHQTTALAVAPDRSTTRNSTFASRKYFLSPVQCILVAYPALGRFLDTMLTEYTNARYPAQVQRAQLGSAADWLPSMLRLATSEQRTRGNGTFQQTLGRKRITTLSHAKNVIIRERMHPCCY